MDRALIETSENPEINIQKINGTLRLKGWDRNQIRVDMEYEDTFDADTEIDTLTLSCKSGCLLRVPNSSTLNIDRVLNDLVVKSLDGIIKANRVNGQVMVKSICTIRVDKTLGNFNAKHIEGDLECGEIRGNANIQDVDGNVILDKVVGNLMLRGYSSSLRAAVNGNANLHLEPEPDGEYKVSAKGNINCRLEPFTNARVILKSKAQKIKIDIPDEKQTLKVKEHVVVLGDGESLVTIEADGNVELSCRSEYRYEEDFEYDDLGDFTTLADDISQMVTGQIEAQMDTISQNINDLTSNLSEMDARTSEKTRRRLEAKRRSLEKKLASAERKVEFRSRQAERRLQQRRRMEKSGRIPASEPVSDEERQKVLEMLQNQQISVAEAEILLAALEGQTPSSPKKETTRSTAGADLPDSDNDQSE